MSAPLLQRVAGGFGTGDAPELRIRTFRLICAMTAVLCLFVVAPLNAFQSLPRGVNVANVVLGLVGAACYWQSLRGRHFVAAFLTVVIVSLDVVWFWNAGLDGSVTSYYFTVLLFAVTLFDGWRRWALAIGVWLNTSLLFLASYFRPDWVIPFQSPLDRVVDLESGILCSMLALGSVAWFILMNYNTEHRRVSEIAARLAASEANYREIFNSTSDALILNRVDGRILDVNEQACVLLGAAKE